MEMIAGHGDLCGECPVWDPRTGILFWTDVIGRRLYRYAPATGEHCIVSEGFEVAGMRLNEGGGFAVVNSKGVWLWNGTGAPRLAAAEVAGARRQMNDCAADAAGRLLSGSCFYNPAGEYPPGKLTKIFSAALCTGRDPESRALRSAGQQSTCPYKQTAAAISRLP